MQATQDLIEDGTLIEQDENHAGMLLNVAWPVCQNETDDRMLKWHWSQVDIGQYDRWLRPTHTHTQMDVVQMLTEEMTVQLSAIRAFGTYSYEFFFSFYIDTLVMQPSVADNM